jgi:glycopeptide antibiotics resistance protein
MLSKFGPSTILAVLFGSFLAVLAFLPMVAVRYRKAGRLRLIDVLLLLACAVYFVALWTYTLVPIPETPNYECAWHNLRPFRFLDDIKKGIAEDHGFRLTNDGLLQAVFNVVLFLPLGGFIRLVFRRGVIVATLVGGLITCIIEYAQYSAVFGLFPCAYRIGDIDDVMLNTAGAFIGSVITWPFAKLLHSQPQPRVTEVTIGRRLVGVLADLMVMLFLSAPTVIVYRAVELYLLHESLDNVAPAAEQFFGFVAAFVVQLLWLIADGRTCGEAIVDLRPVIGSRRGLRLIIKFCTGVGMFLVLYSFQFPYQQWLLGVFCLVSVILLFIHDDHRGLTGLAGGMPMQIDPPRPPR